MGYGAVTRGIATSFNADGTIRYQNVEVVRWYGAEKHCLLRFDGNPIAYVKLKVNVERIEPKTYRFTGRSA